MNAYRLEATLIGYMDDGTMEFLEHKFDFVAGDDKEAIAMVDTFYRVCHPVTHGPLYRTGQSDTRDGLTAIYIGGEPQLIPLEVKQLAPLPKARECPKCGAALVDVQGVCHHCQEKTL